MADITVNATGNALHLGMAVECRLIPVIADEAITNGQAVYRKTNGRAGLARGNAVGTSKLLGIATGNAIAGQAFEALYHGRAFGYDLSGVNPGVTVYLSAATAGALADAAATGTGNVVVPVGTVHVMTDRPATKFLFVDIPLNAVTPTALS
jgi:hypothetical protein